VLGSSWGGVRTGADEVLRRISVTEGGGSGGNMVAAWPVADESTSAGSRPTGGEEPDGGGFALPA
jgi:hypothetical protein